MSSITAHYTRSGANEGIRIPLANPDGSDTGDWLHVLSVDSDAFRRASADSDRRIMEAAIESRRSGKAYDQAGVYAEERLRRIASLILFWSFEEPVTDELKVEFLRNAPQVADRIDSIAVERRRFIRKPLEVSTPTPPVSSS